MAPVELVGFAGASSAARKGARLTLVGLATPQGYACPLSQYLLADALGLSALHVNRVLRAFREAGLVTLQKDRVGIHDPSGLVGLADSRWPIWITTGRC